MQNSQIRDIDPTTRRLVDRCFSGEWCVQYRKANVKEETGREPEVDRQGSPGSHSVASAASTAPIPSTSKSSTLERQASGKIKTLKTSKSVENLKAKSKPPRPPRLGLSSLRRPSTDSAGSLPGIAAATTSASKRREQVRSGDLQNSFSTRQSERHHQNRSHGDSVYPSHPPLPRADSIGTGLDGLVSQPPPHPPSPASSLPTSSSFSSNSKTQSGTTHRRSAPPTPAKRRKPPAVPAERTNSGATITTIASSNATQSLRVTKGSEL